MDHRAALEAAAPEESGSLVPSSWPYAALVEGAPDSEALALAFQLLCDTAGAECTVVRGTLDGQEHFWNIVTVDGSHRHVDASLGRDGFYLTDQDYQALSGAEWSAEDYPACGEKIEFTP